MIIIRYRVNCFDRELCIELEDRYKEFENEILETLDDAYCTWNSTDDIEDTEERIFVENSCCEEFMMKKLSEIYNMWDSWWVEGDVDENGDEEPIYVIENPNLEHYTQTYITLDAEELMLLGIEPEYWDDCEIVNDAIHNMIYERKK